ncbi:asparagine synthase-related protein [Deinococcus humi]|uniref:asparagine synthase (glutamine-hydrolyzing) n=1 Tax=Deinococcus humi TaxID=662880 RepID=A0A7W8NEK9_9DEIO|nr:asparagine synthase (glutamine-hydrolyzing) [Deinococcus humi]
METRSPRTKAQITRKGFTLRLSRLPQGVADTAELTLPHRLDQPFALSQTWVDFGGVGAASLVLPQRGLAVVLRGVLYSHELQDVLSLYMRHGLTFADHLEGSFALILVDQQAGHIWAVTDRIGSVKVYAAQQDGKLLVSTDLNQPAFTQRPLSPAGVACALASGVMLGDLTVYQGVRSLERVCVHDLKPEGVTSRPYWTFSFGPPSRRPAAELQAELAGLLRAAVDRRLRRAGPRVFLSLSGGYDSRGLLSLLSGSGREIHTFAYSDGPPRMDSDADVAGQLARQYGARHVTLQAYRGDLDATLQRNAAWGQGVANFCDEADAWAELAEHAPSAIFAGEQLFGWYDRPAQTMTELLQHARLPDAQALSGLQGVLQEGDYARLRDAYGGELQALTQRLPSGLDPTQLETLTYLEQLGPRRLMPWREQFAGRVAPVHLPLLDGQLLDFMQTLPRQLIREKTLFKGALLALDPGLLSVPLARVSGYAPDWNAELLRHRGALKRQLGTGHSRLDEFVPPETVMALLDRLGPDRKNPVRSALGALRRTPLMGAALGVRPPLPRPVDRATLLLRLLTLRRLAE